MRTLRISGGWVPRTRGSSEIVGMIPAPLRTTRAQRGQTGSAFVDRHRWVRRFAGSIFRNNAR
jgi:hypothetical protein